MLLSADPLDDGPGLIVVPVVAADGDPEPAEPRHLVGRATDGAGQRDGRFALRDRPPGHVDRGPGLAEPERDSLADAAVAPVTSATAPVSGRGMRNSLYFI